jgi:ankyrin repeat protein
MTKTKSVSGMSNALGTKSLATLLLEEDWTTRLDTKPKSLLRPREPEVTWALPDLDIDIRLVTVNDFVTICGCGLVDDAASILEEYPNWDVNAINDVGDTALHAACHHGQIDVVILLLDCPATDVNFENDGWRPLHIAADRGDLDIVRLLISRGADPNAIGQGGMTPVHLACLKMQAPVVEELVLIYDVDVNLETVGNRTVNDGKETPLHLAALGGSFDCMDILLRHAKTDYTAVTAMGWNVLHIAAEHGHTDVVELILWYIKWNKSMGIDANAPNCGWTPLHLACDEGHVEIMLLLLMCGEADANYKAYGGFAPLHLAAGQGHTEAVKALVSRKAVDKDIRTDGGSTALIIACENNCSDVVSTLLKAGADASCATLTGDTALHTVADKGFADLWKLLIDAGVTPNAPNHAGITPTELAASKGYSMQTHEMKKSYTTLMECVEDGDAGAVDRFIQTNKDPKFVNATDKDGRTALHVAAEHGYYRILCKLLQYSKISVNAVSHTGNTTLHIAAALGHRKMVKKLLAHRDINVTLLNKGWTPVSLHNMMPDSSVYAAFERSAGLQGVFVHDGREALHAAAGAAHTLITKMLLQHPNTDVNTRTRGLMTCLHLAAERGDLDMVEVLCTFRKHHIDINAQDAMGCTPLHDACRGGHRAVVNYLLKLPGIDVNAMTYRYQGQNCYYKRSGTGTPLHVACEYGNEAVARTLLRCPQINPSLPTPWGATTPLHVAASVGLVSIVEKLLTCDNVDINGLQDDGSTAWDLAYKAGHQHVLEILTPVNPEQAVPPYKIAATSAMELQELALQRYELEGEYLSHRTGYACVIRFQSSGKGYNPSSVSVMGDWNDWNIYSAAPLIPIRDRGTGCTWITVLRLPVGESSIQFIIDGVRGVDNTRLDQVTLEYLYRNNIAHCKPPTMPTLKHCVEGIRINEAEKHTVKVLPPLAQPACIPPHEYLVRVIETKKMSFRKEATVSQEEPDEPKKPEKPSMGLEIRFCKDERTKQRNVPVVTLVKPGGASDEAGIDVEDIILSIDGHPILGKQDMVGVLSVHEPGDTLPVVVYRDGLELNLELCLTTFSGEKVVKKKPEAVEEEVQEQAPPPKKASYRKTRPLSTQHSFWGLN